jgi:hypothetical protein
MRFQKIILCFLFFASISFGQTITFTPKADSINIVGGCIGAYIKYSLTTSQQFDTVKINAGSESSIFYYNNSAQRINLSSAKFIIDNSNNKYNYEIWLQSKSNVKMCLKKDSSYRIPYFQYYAKLIVRKDNSPIDSLSQYFHSDWGLGIEQNDANSIPDKFELMQNYPNPFNPSTKIKYSLSAPGYANIKIYNLMGQEIATLLNEEKSAGNYEVKFDGTKLPSGIYFYTLLTGNFVQTKKMVLIK